MEISIIAAVSQNNVIGKDNGLIWHLPADMKFFKGKTTGHTVIMGRKTFDSIGKPLPNRTTIIITRNPSYKAPEGCLTANSLKQAFAMCNSQEEVFICGGAQIYAAALAVATKFYLTEVHENFDGDTVFPEWNKSEWQLQSEESHHADEKNKYAYSFMTYSKREK